MKRANSATRKTSVSCKAKTWLLIGCGSKKAPRSRRADQLYTGSLTTARIAYAKRQQSPWLILSAAHGLIAPETWLAPYNVCLDGLTADKLAIWQTKVAAQIAGLLAPEQPPADLTIELHAGLDYRNAIAPLLRLLGFNVTEPLARLGLIGQLNFYRR